MYLVDKNTHGFCTLCIEEIFGNTAIYCFGNGAYFSCSTVVIASSQHKLALFHYRSFMVRAGCAVTSLFLDLLCCSFKCYNQWRND